MEGFIIGCTLSVAEERLHRQRWHTPNQECQYNFPKKDLAPNSNSKFVLHLFHSNHLLIKYQIQMRLRTCRGARWQMPAPVMSTVRR